MKNLLSSHIKKRLFPLDIYPIAILLLSVLGFLLVGYSCYTDLKGTTTTTKVLPGNVACHQYPQAKIVSQNGRSKSTRDNLLDKSDPNRHREYIEDHVQPFDDKKPMGFPVNDRAPSPPMNPNILRGNNKSHKP